MDHLFLQILLSQFLITITVKEIDPLLVAMSIEVRKMVISPEDIFLVISNLEESGVC